VILENNIPFRGIALLNAGLLTPEIRSCQRNLTRHIRLRQQAPIRASETKATAERVDSLIAPVALYPKAENQKM